MSMGNLAGLIGIVGAGMSGYAKGKRQHDQDEEERTARDDETAWRKESRARQRKQWSEDDALQTSMRAAAAPRLAQSAESYQPSVDDDGNPMPENSTAGTYKIDDQFTPAGQRQGTYASMADATRAAGAANAPQSALARMADAQMQSGRPDKALALKAGARQETAAEQQLADAQFERGLRSSLVTPAALATFMSESHADGAKGAVKFQAVPSSDGKSWQMHTVGEGGKLEPVGPQFSADDTGMATAGYLLSRSVSPQQRVEHYRALAKDQEEGAYKKGMLAVAQQNAATNEGYRALAGQAAVTNANARAAAPARKADHFDEKQWDSATKIEPSFVSFAGEDGKAVESPALRLTYLRELNAARAAGDMAPNEAAEAARTVTLRVRNIAEARVAKALEANPRSTLTPSQAVKQILAEAATWDQATKDTKLEEAESGPAVNAPAVMTRQTPAQKSERTLRTERAAKSAAAMKDPDVVALQQQASSAASGRAARDAEAKLAALLRQRYGI